jgi:hypothetical protein
MIARTGLGHDEHLLNYFLAKINNFSNLGNFVLVAANVIVWKIQMAPFDE